MQLMYVLKLIIKRLVVKNAESSVLASFVMAAMLCYFNGFESQNLLKFYHYSPVHKKCNVCLNDFGADALIIFAENRLIQCKPSFFATLYPYKTCSVVRKSA